MEGEKPVGQESHAEEKQKNTEQIRQIQLPKPLRTKLKNKKQQQERLDIHHLPGHTEQGQK